MSGIASKGARAAACSVRLLKDRKFWMLRDSMLPFPHGMRLHTDCPRLTPEEKLLHGVGVRWGQSGDVADRVPARKEAAWMLNRGRPEGRRSFASLGSQCHALWFGLRTSTAGTGRDVSVVGRRAFSSREAECSDTLETVPTKNIRNFSIIAHVDHGKSTLSDRLLQYTGTLVADDKAQYLDKLQVERERGITVKAQTATLIHEHKGETFILNLIDTPGHVDFSYEVSRSLAACEGVLLLVDAAQGVQAQTLSNFLLAKKAGLAIVPVVNKIDLPGADLDRCAAQILSALGFDVDELHFVSGKTGEGVEELLEGIVEAIPPPPGDAAKYNLPLQARLFDTWFETFRGVVCLVRVTQGTLLKGDKVLMKSSKAVYDVQEVGIMHPEPVPVRRLHAGQVGYLHANIKTPGEARVGDTLCGSDDVEALGGFKAPVPMVFAGIYPVDSNDYETLDKAMQRLTLNDTSVTMQRESSNALGLGFRCGFLGLLHMDVFRLRLQQEHNTNIIVTSPTVPYQARMKKKPDELVTVSNPSLFPDPGEVLEFLEPFILATVIVPSEFLGEIMDLCLGRRGQQRDMKFLDHSQVMLSIDLPLAEVVTDFYDQLKSLSKGYASLEYEPSGYQTARVVKLSFSLNQRPVDAFTTIVHHSNADKVGRGIAQRLKGVLDRQQFEIAIQATVGGKVVARETVKAVRKNVLERSGKAVGGGDVSRKKKLLERQKEGKKKMKRVGNVDISQEAFLSVMNAG